MNKEDLFEEIAKLLGDCDLSSAEICHVLTELINIEVKVLNGMEAD